MNRFGQRTKHIFSGKQSIPSSFPTYSFLASRYYNAQLHQLFGDAFLNNLPSESSLVDANQMSIDEGQYIPGRPFMKFHLLPIRRQGIETLIDYEQKQITELQSFLIETYPLYPYLEEFLQRKTMITQRQQEQEQTDEEYSIYFLGTGCAIPSKYRNVSSILVYLSSTQSGFLLDCGEGSWFQLMYLCPPTLRDQEDTDSIRRATEWSKIIKLVWISHPHADHHLGLVTFIIQRKRYLLLDSSTGSFTPLMIVAPMIVYSFLREITRLYEELEGAYLFIPVNYFDPTENCLPCIPSGATGTIPKIIPSQIPSIVTAPSSTIFSTSQSFAEEHMGEEISTIPPDESEIDNKIPKKRQKLLIDDYLDYMNHHFHDFNSTSNESKSLFDIIDQQFSLYGILSLANIPVIHCRQSYGLILTIQTNQLAPSSSIRKPMKLVYSGDTRPCDSLAHYGQDADVLIHEATFEDDKAIEAFNKRHSTIHEAIGIGQRMNCKALILTHFSQRYHGAPGQFIPPDGHNTHPIQWIDEQAKLSPLQPIIAFDFLHVNNLNLSWLSYLTPMIAEIFAKDQDDENDDENDDDNAEKNTKEKKKQPPPPPQQTNGQSLKGKTSKESTTVGQDKKNKKLEMK